MNELHTLGPFSFDPIDDAFRSLMWPWRLEMPEAAPRIRLDLVEEDARHTVKAEIPGVKKDDIDIRVDGNMVTISAEVKTDREEKGNGGAFPSTRTTDADHGTPQACSDSPRSMTLNSGQGMAGHTSVCALP